MGEMIGIFDKVCQNCGVTPLLVHHCQKHAGRSNGRQTYQPLSLQDIHGAGFGEYMRQWWLLSPRGKFNSETFRNQFWLRIGGSEGQSGDYIVDIYEGYEPTLGTRQYAVSADYASNVIDHEKAQKEQRAADTDNLRLEAVYEALRTGGPNTLEGLKSRCQGSRSKISGSLKQLVEDGRVKPTKVTKGNNQEYNGFKAI